MATNLIASSTANSSAPSNQTLTTWAALAQLPTPTTPTSVQPYTLIFNEGIPEIVVPISQHVFAQHLHYLPEIKKFIQCLDPVCLACKLGYERILRYVTPVFLPTTGDVKYLAISDSQRSKALMPQLLPLNLQFITSEKPTYLQITRLNNTDYDVQVITPSASFNYISSQALTDFLEAEQAGKIDYAAAFARIENAELLKTPAIKVRAELLGLSVG